MSGLDCLDDGRLIKSIPCGFLHRGKFISTYLIHVCKRIADQKLIWITRYEWEYSIYSLCPTLKCLLVRQIDCVFGNLCSVSGQTKIKIYTFAKRSHENKGKKSHLDNKHEIDRDYQPDKCPLIKNKKKESSGKCRLQSNNNCIEMKNDYVFFLCCYAISWMIFLVGCTR